MTTEMIDFLLAELDKDEEDFRTLGMTRMVRQVEMMRIVFNMWEDPDDIRHLPTGVHDGRDWDEVEAQVAVACAIDNVVRILGAAYMKEPGFKQVWLPYGIEVD